MGNKTTTTIDDHGALTGLSDDDHTQYVLRSILTTRGDLPVRGASDWTRLGVGATNTVLTANGTDPAWSATPTVTTLTTTGLLTAGDGLTVSAGTVTLPASSLVVGTTQLVTTATGVGVGLAEPVGKLHVTTVASPTTPHVNADDFTFEGSGLSGMSLLSSAGGNFQIYFGEPGDLLAARIRYDHTTDIFEFGGHLHTDFIVGDVVKMRLDNLANLAIGAAAFGTSAARVLGLSNGTAPSTAPADLTQLWSGDIGGAAGKASLLMMSESGTGVQTVVGVITKTDTGDPAQVHGGLVVINEFDNNIRMYADGAYRTLATW